MSNEFSTPGKYREKNTKVIEKALETNEDAVELASYMQRKHGVKLFSKDAAEQAKFPVREAGFSWKSARKKLMEADASGAFPQLLRAGVQTVANDAYKTVSTTFEDWTTTVQSNKDTELYAPLHGVGFPKEVGAGEVYPEVGAAGLDISLKNKKYGTMYAVQQEMMDDDQTGQVNRQSALLGEYMKILLEALCYGKLASVSNMQYAQYLIPPTETKPTDEVNGYPYATQASPFIGGGWNRPASFSIFSQSAFVAARQQLMSQKNKLGLKMLVDGNRLIAGVGVTGFDMATLMNSSYYASGAATAGSIGGAFSVNVFKGLADVTVSRFVFKNDGTVDGDSKAWYLMDSNKPFFITQLHTPMALVQEAPNAGESFNRDVIRFKVSMRANADFIDPRFVFQGNDGSVTS